jgi:hypothetical protein
MTDQPFVVVTRSPIEGGAVVRAWGPYPTRSLAISAMQRMRRHDQRERGEVAGQITYHVCEVAAPPPDPHVIEAQALRVWLAAHGPILWGPR